MELTSLTIHEAANLLKQKEISPVELTQAHLERIQHVDQHLNSFITVTPELAMQQARAGREGDPEWEYYRGYAWHPIGFEGSF